MVAINTILIIVNGGPPNAFEPKRIIVLPVAPGNFSPKKAANLRLEVKTSR
jgi:hypothetical protein